MDVKEKILKAKYSTPRTRGDSFLISKSKINGGFFIDAKTKLPRNQELLNEIISYTTFLPKGAPTNERIYCVLNDITDRVICSCGSLKPLRFQNANRGYWKTCGKSCEVKTKHRNESLIGRKKTQQENDKRLATIRLKYGVDNVFQNKDIKKKIYTPENNAHRTMAIKQAVQLKYGVDNVFQLDSVKETIKNTNLDKYGVENPTQEGLPNEIFNADWLTRRHHTEKQSASAISQELGIDVSTVINALKRLNIEQQYYGCVTSYLEHEMSEFLDSLNIQYKSNNRNLLGGIELDFYIPEFNLAIEMNGLYWHSTEHKHKKYHQDKTNACEENGIRLIHIFEDEWLYQKEKCQDTLKHFFGLSKRGTYGRQATIKEISWKSAKEFLNKYHLLNAGVAGNYRIGAFNKDDTLIAVMIYGKTSNESGDTTSIELKRFVTDKNNNPGVASKMFTYAVRQRGYSEIIAFVDRRWFTGLVKKHIGFDVVGYTNPALWYIKGSERFHRRFISKNTLINNSECYNHTKKQMLYEMGYYQLYDSGKLKLVWRA